MDENGLGIGVKPAEERLARELELCSRDYPSRRRWIVIIMTLLTYGYPIQAIVDIFDLEFTLILMFSFSGLDKLGVSLFGTQDK